MRTELATVGAEPDILFDPPESFVDDGESVLSNFDHEIDREAEYSGRRK